MVRNLLRKKELLFVILCAIFVILLSTSSYFAQLLRIPPHHVFVGLTHYFEDYYYYLDQFYQGAHGSWLTRNNFTTEILPPSLIYINHIILGKIGGWLGLTPYTSYNLSLLILKLAFILLCYKLLIIIFPDKLKYRLSAFLIFLFSTSLPVIKWNLYEIRNLGPLLVFRAKNTFFSKFGNVPGPYIDNILFLLLIIISFKYFSWVREDLKKISFLTRKSLFYLFTLSILVLWLTISDAAKSVVFLVFFALGLILSRRQDSKRYFLVSLVSVAFVALSFLLSALYLYNSLSTDPVYLQALVWDYQEYANQFNYMKFGSYIHSFGILGILVCLGFIYTFRNKNTFIEKLVVAISLISLVGFIIPKIANLPIPGFRFILASTYLFLSVVALKGILFIEQILKKKIAFLIIFLYLTVSFLTIYPAFIKEITPLKEPEFHFAYIPDELYQGFMALRKMEPKEAIVLASPRTATDLFIPGMTGKKTFTGHFLTNLNSAEKDKMADQFFYQWTDEKTAVDFLKKNNIKYIVHTFYSYNYADNELYKKYPFLKEMYRNNLITIYSY